MRVDSNGASKAGLQGTPQLAAVPCPHACAGVIPSLLLPPALACGKTSTTGWSGRDAAEAGGRGKLPVRRRCCSERR